MEKDDKKDCAQAQGILSSQKIFRPAPHYCFRRWCATLYLVASAICSSQVWAGALDQLSDFTDKEAHAVVTLKGRDNFNSEYLYDVRVKNSSSNSLVGGALVIVLDKITNIGGSEWMAGTSKSNLDGMEILGQDGETEDGKPYFRISGRLGEDLPPYTESSSSPVRIRNKNYLVVFTPIFRVYGKIRFPVSPKPKEAEPASTTNSASDEKVM